MDAEQLRLERIADIEGNVRLANEHILGPVRDATAAVTIRCECGDPACARPIAVHRDEYERVRADSMLFLVHPGHVIPEAEDVVEPGADYDVIRKHEIMRPVVERSDPRR